MGSNKFKEGNPYRFTTENQPSGENKSRGKRKAMNARSVALEALKGARITDEKIIAPLKEIFPNVKVFYGYHLTIGRLYHLAAKGNVKAMKQLMKLSGDLDDRPAMATGDNTIINITTASETGKENIEKLMNIHAND